jgi:hypothetical protein
MGYGIKILTIQSPLLKVVLKGEEDRWGFGEEVKETCYEIDNVSDDLFRLSGWTTDFIGNCKTLFTIFEMDEEEGEFWDNIYIWRWKYCKMEWSELKPIVEPIIDEFVSKMTYELNETEKTEIIYTLERLHSITGISRTFQIC